MLCSGTPRSSYLLDLRSSASRTSPGGARSKGRRQGQRVGHRLPSFRPVGCPVRLVPVPPRLRSATKLDLIARVPLFAALSKSERGQVASIADEIDLPGDKLLIREGEPGREFFVLLEGEVEVTRKGKRLATRRSGEFFGEIALVSRLPRTATVKTRGPVRALVIRDVDLRAVLKRTPAIAVKVLEAVADRLPADAV